MVVLCVCIIMTFLFFFLMIRRPTRSTLFPYTTLFRSDNADQASFLPLGQLEAMARALNEMDVRELLMLGKVPKSLLFDGRGIVDPDEEALRLLSQLPALGDENLMRSISRWLEGRGFSICDQGKELAPLLAPVGALSARVPSDSEYADFEFEIGRAHV